jgi:hypothetical protein
MRTQLHDEPPVRKSTIASCCFLYSRMPLPQAKTRKLENGQKQRTKNSDGASSAEPDGKQQRTPGARKRKSMSDGSEERKGKPSMCSALQFLFLQAQAQAQARALADHQDAATMASFLTKPSAKCE